MTQNDKGSDDKVTVIEGEVVYMYPTTSENVDIVKRDERGRWIKGGAPPPPESRLTRRKKDRSGEQALMQALEAAMPADKIEYWLGQALEYAVYWKSTKNILDVVKLRLAYGLGMPVQRSITASTKLDDLLNRVAELDDEQFDRLEESI